MAEPLPVNMGLGGQFPDARAPGVEAPERLASSSCTAARRVPRIDSFDTLSGSAHRGGGEFVAITVHPAPHLNPMKRTFLAASLVLLPLTFACQPELEATAVPSTAQSPDETITLEKKSLAGVPFVTLEAVETARSESPWYVYVATDYYVTFWADRARTNPVNLGAAIQLNYVSTYSDYKYNTSMRSNLSTNLQPGSHSYYIGSGTYECDYDANGNPDHRCGETWFSLRNGVGYDGSY
ncbi:hypothetical protein F0U60_50390 [Archangium minus]|uniref:Lipoprotein n=1 Tax=Archangium minus TaxID=83450 RepID=A0ABY9X7R6_9BACT|nr:hypothetical protein F0U60_50390 [Archangium minus]